MTAPVIRPTAIVIHGINGWPSSIPNICGSHAVWVIPITAVHVASNAPTDKSIWRVTITNTIPVAMIATDTVWIVRLNMLRGVRKRPSVSTLKIIQTNKNAPIMPNKRVSISSDFKKERGFWVFVVSDMGSLHLGGQIQAWFTMP